MRNLKLKTRVNKLNEGEKLFVSATIYGKPMVYEISCYDIYNGEKSFAMREVAGFLNGSMNISKITDKLITLYTFDMFSKKSTNYVSTKIFTYLTADQAEFTINQIENK